MPVVALLAWITALLKLLKSGTRLILETWVSLRQVRHNITFLTSPLSIQEPMSRENKHRSCVTGLLKGLFPLNPQLKIRKRKPKHLSTHANYTKMKRDTRPMVPTRHKRSPWPHDVAQLISFFIYCYIHYIHLCQKFWGQAPSPSQTKTLNSAHAFHSPKKTSLLVDF